MTKYCTAIALANLCAPLPEGRRDLRRYYIDPLSTADEERYPVHR